MTSNNNSLNTAKDCQMYKAGENTDLCQHCGSTLWAHPMSRRRYYNDPDTRAFFEYADNAPWWHVVVGWILILIILPIAIVARLLGWRPEQ